MSDFKSTKKYQEAVQWRDWQTCDLIAEEHSDLVKEITQIKEALRDMSEALFFYGDDENWDDDPYTPTIWDDGNIELGRKARETLSKHQAIIEQLKQGRGE